MRTSPALDTLPSGAVIRKVAHAPSPVALPPPSDLIMTRSFVLLALAVPLLGRAQQPTLTASPVSRIEVTPRSHSVAAGDSIILQARAVDRNGATVSGARIFFTQSGGSGEGSI